MAEGAVADEGNLGHAGGRLAARRLGGEAGGGDEVAWAKDGGEQGRLEGGDDVGVVVKSPGAHNLRQAEVSKRNCSCLR